MNYPRWSKLSQLAGLFSLGIAAASIASAQAPVISVDNKTSSQTVSTRIPGTYASGSNPLAPAGLRAEFEGPNATDYFNFQPFGNILANPQIAVGPEDIVMVVNKQIFRVQNGNAAGVRPAVLYPNYAATAGQANSFQREFLDDWIGEAPLAALCPTGNPSATTNPAVPADPGNTRSAATCQIENATVTYDQMHGRFLVLFTVIDTGLTFNGQGFVLTRPRKASWVLLVSRFAVLLDQACLQGTTTTSCPNQGPNPGGNPNPAGTFAFAAPTPPANGTGGINTAIWAIYYGNAVDTLGSDGFGSTIASAGVGAGNINALPGIAGAAASFDCGPAAVAAAGAVPAKVCYLPTGARLGVDNDTITLVSPVVNSNINQANLSLTFNTVPVGLGGTPFSSPAYAGNRVRILKKSAVYNFAATLAAGNQFAATDALRSVGALYDLYTNTTAAGAPVAYDATAATGLSGTYTVVASGANCPTATVPSFLTVTKCSPLFYEPVHLRGRALATFSNSDAYSAVVPPAIGGPANSLSQTYLLGAIDNASAFFDSNLYVQGIREIHVPVTTPSFPSTFAPNPFYPMLQSGIDVTTTSPVASSPVAFPVQPFANPGTVPQQTFRSGSPAPALNVGDDRPHVVVFREGHLYDARVITPLNPSGTFSTPTALTTVAYDIVQKLNNPAVAPATPTGGVSQGQASALVPVAGASVAPIPVLGVQWQNTNAYAPMFDVPANVKTFGANSPSQGSLSFLEKLFTATTNPPLSGFPDAPLPVAYDPYQSAGDPRSRETYGLSGGVPQQITSPLANCFDYQLAPGSTPSLPGANAPRSWVSLFDIRCGTDAIDSNPQVRDPFSGISAGQTAYTYRGGAAIDPNDGSLWEFGAYAQLRKTSVQSLAAWGTFAANYKLSFPTTDVYGNASCQYTDVTGIPEYAYVVIAANVGLAPNTACSEPNIVTVPFAANPVYTTGKIPGVAPAAGTFGGNDEITRREMAYWIVKSQMDEAGINAYLASTGGNFATFADVPNTDPGYRYIEVMARRGYTSGCLAGVARRYCPDYISTRRDLAVFMIRAKFNNVFPSVLSGCSFAFVNGTTTNTTFFPIPATTNCNTFGDNFATFVTGTAYFTDNPAVTGNDWYFFVQKMRELRITVGTNLGPNLDGRLGVFSLGGAGLPPQGDPGNLLRKQVATFMVRGFFF